ncbi:MAG: DUF4340 domain-containing protein [Bacillota bacterium]
MKKMNRLFHTGLLLIILAVLAGLIWWLTSTQEAAVSERYARTLDKKTVEKIHIINKNMAGESQEIVLALQNGKWMMLSPESSEASPEAVSQILGVFEKFTAENAFKTKNLSEYGLDKPQLTVKLFRKKASPLEFQLGAATPVNNNFYARFTDTPEVFVFQGYQRYNLDMVPERLKKPQQTASPK